MPHKCPVCKKAFRKADHRNQHEASVHPKKIFGPLVKWQPGDGHKLLSRMFESTRVLKLDPYEPENIPNTLSTR